MGPYQILEEIARGGMGFVYKARHQRVGRVVALKTLRPDPSGSHQFAERFEREMRAVARLQHRHIITVYEFGEQDGQPFFTMALVPGGSLSLHRERLRQDPRAVLALMEKVARAVHYAHQQGVLHRDLKPGNVLLDSDEPLVTDFGLAKLQDADDELTGCGAVPGTPAYMAPEQASGSRPLGPSVDIWALGVILYELLTGRRPFAASSREELLRKICTDAPTPLRELRPELSPAIEMVVSRCLQQRPEQRYASAEALADDLARLQRGEAPRDQPARKASLFRGRTARFLLLGLAAVALVAAVVLSLMLKEPPPPSPAQPPPLVLIGKDGLAAARWRVGDAAEIWQSHEGAVSLRSSGLGLLELLESPPWKHFHLEAEVLHEGGDEGEVGIFCAWKVYPSLRGPQHGFWKLGFADRGRHRNEHLLGFGRCPEAPPHELVDHPVGGDPNQAPSRKAEPGSLLWRPMALDVTTEGVDAWWEGHLLGHAALDLVLDVQDRMIHGKSTGLGSFNPEGGLGIFVYRGTASFRQVTLHPRP
jgi:hypothetical protein